MINLTNKKILLVRNDNIGDLICTTPAIESLRKRYPDIKIDMVVNSYNYSAIYKNPFVDTVHCYTKSKHEPTVIKKIKSILNKIIILFRIKRLNYDAVVVFRSDYSKSAEIFSNITNAKYRVGVKDIKNNSDNYNIHITPSEFKHEVEFCFDCLKEFDVAYNNEKSLYFVNNALINKYQKFKKYILFHISSRIEDNRFSKENFVKVINNLKEYNVVISFEPKDQNDAIWINKNSDASIVKTTSLVDLAGLIKNVQLFVTLDGGAMHVGPSVGTKTISISGKTNMKKWYPWGYSNLVIQDKSRIANNIPLDRVVQLIKITISRRDW